MTIDFLTNAIKANNMEAIKEYANYTNNITKDLSLLNLAEIHGSKELNDELKKVVNKQNKENSYHNVASLPSKTIEKKKLRDVLKINQIKNSSLNLPNHNDDFAPSTLINQEEIRTAIHPNSTPNTSKYLSRKNLRRN